MNQLHIFPDTQTLAQAVVDKTLDQLRQVIDMYDTTVWVLAGGTAPMLAYRLVAANHLAQIDWSRVTFVIGDERIGPLDGPDNNWQVIDEVLLQYTHGATYLRPPSDQSAESAATAYAKQLALLPQTADGLPRLDIVWLGMGPDGHTLSLFPDHPSFQPSKRLVIPVHHSPKPPSDRISLTLHALAGAQTTMILASGDSKAAAVKQAFRGDTSLPIQQAAAITNAEWFIDQAAAGQL